MRQSDVSIIIVSYNTKKLLIECIESIVKSVKKSSYEIIVVDNASRDGTVQEVRSKKYEVRSVKIIENEKNVGFSKANNIGAKESKGRYLLFLNPDTVMYEKTIDGMVGFMEKNRDSGAATCFVELPNGKLDDAAHRGFPTPWRALCHFSGLSKFFPRSRLFAGYSLGWEDKSKVHEIDACAGAFMIVRRKAGEEVGWWDEDYFWYGEDLDFCFRLEEKGWKIFFVPEFKILHYKGVSGGIKKHSQHLTTATAETRKRAIDARFEAMKLFYSKHYKHKYPFMVSLIVLSGIKIRSLVSKML